MHVDYLIIILAAGGSRRLGRPKQLVLHNGVTLLNTTIQEAEKLKGADVLVVLGSRSDEIFLTMPKVDCIINVDWKKGMGSSIAFAMNAISNKKYKGIILTTCDQPFLDSSILNSLITEHKRSQKGIIISKYDKGMGIPSFFYGKYFQDLKELNSDEGAKVVIRNNVKDVGFVAFPKGDIDIDTKVDLNLLKAR